MSVAPVTHVLKMDDRFMSLEEWEAERLRDPAFVIALAAREPAYQVARLRILRGLTQQHLTELAGTKQSWPDVSG